MMLLNCVYKLLEFLHLKRKNPKGLILGLDNSGKTTFTYVLKKNQN